MIQPLRPVARRGLGREPNIHRAVWELACQVAGAAAQVVVEDVAPRGYVVPTGPVLDAVRLIMASFGFDTPPEGYAR